MIDALVAGLLAGLSVAVFVATAAMAVMQTAVARGLAVALAARGAVATGDALWAPAAAGAVAAFGSLLAPWGAALRWVAVGLLTVVLLLALYELARGWPRAGVVALSETPLRGYSEFLVPALGHPATAVLFASLIVGAVSGYKAGQAVAFGAGVFLASLSWQWMLAFVGARRRRIFSGRTRRIVMWLDCALLALFIVYLALGLDRV